MSDHKTRRPFIHRHEAVHVPGARTAPSAERNQAAIIEMLRGALGQAGVSRGRALELASGTGQHVVAFAEAFPNLHWQPSDRDDEALASIAAWHAHAGLDNITAPVRIDLGEENWHRAVDAPVDLMLAINLLHISPWAVTQAFLSGAAGLLGEGGIAVVYGCFRRDGDWVSDSNRAFDASLRGKDSRWGVRDTRDVDAEAARHGLAVRDVIAMPANNTVMVFGQRTAHIV